jgi:hypothetical protein
MKFPACRGAPAPDMPPDMPEARAFASLPFRRLSVALPSLFRRPVPAEIDGGKHGVTPPFGIIDFK